MSNSAHNPLSSQARARAQSEPESSSPEAGSRASLPQGRNSLRERRKRLGINQSLFAKIGGISLRTVVTYEDAEELPAKVRRQFYEALRLSEALADLFGEHLVEWLQEPNAGFDDRTPLEVIESGEVDQLWDLIHQQRHYSFD